MPEIAFVLYDPDPPFDSGSVEKADAATRERATPLGIPSGDPEEVAG